MNDKDVQRMRAKFRQARDEVKARLKAMDAAAAAAVAAKKPKPRKWSWMFWRKQKDD